MRDKLQEPIHYFKVDPELLFTGSKFYLSDCPRTFQVSRAKSVCILVSKEDPKVRFAAKWKEVEKSIWKFQVFSPVAWLEEVSRSFDLPQSPTHFQEL